MQGPRATAARPAGGAPAWGGVGAGPARLFSPLPPAAGAGGPGAAGRAGLPLLYYLPGLDGSGLAVSSQFDSLLRRFDLRALQVPPDSRATFPELVELVRRGLAAEDRPPERPVYLLGESMGGVTALLAAHALGPDACDRVVLVNPATSFPRSAWARVGGLLPELPPELYRGLPFALSPLFGNPLRMAARRVDPAAPLPEQLGALLAGVEQMGPILGGLNDLLPQDTLAFKLGQLAEGAAAVEAILPEVEQRVLVVTSEDDWLLPSRDEGPRLKRRLRTCHVEQLEGRSHALLQEDGVDLVQIMDGAGFYVRERAMSSRPSRGDADVRRLPSAPAGGSGGGGSGAEPRGRPKVSPIARPLELPTRREVELSMESSGTKAFRDLVSPVFYSTDAEGSVAEGLGNIPDRADGKPLLFVGNHQTAAPDLGFLISEFLLEKDVLLRGLTHPALFRGPGGAGAGGMQSLFTSFGAVPVSPFNLHKLLSDGEAVMLFPGGVREAYKGKGEEYRLFWPAEGEFVRMAAKFGATIVPFSAIGADDSVEMVASSQDLLNLPVLGDLIKERTKDIPAARQAGEEQPFVPPVLVPKTLPRYYFLFGEPIELAPELAKDREGAAAVYRRAKRSVEDGLEYLQRLRAVDPYKDFLGRRLYEASWGGTRRAPSAKPLQKVVRQRS